MVASRRRRVPIEEQVWRDNVEVRTSCAYCSWTFEGKAFDAREQAAEHRRRRHPELPHRTPIPRRKIVPPTDAELAAIAEKIRGGAKLHAIAREIWERHGYRNQASCSASLTSMLRDRGLPTTAKQAAAQNLPADRDAGKPPRQARHDAGSQPTSLPLVETSAPDRVPVLGVVAGDRDDVGPLVDAFLRWVRAKAVLDAASAEYRDAFEALSLLIPTGIPATLLYELGAKTDRRRIA